MSTIDRAPSDRAPEAHPEIGATALRGAAIGSVVCAAGVAIAVIASGAGGATAFGLAAASALTGGPFFGAFVAVSRQLLAADLAG
ncbi:MAG: hypothetical protein JJE52_07725 [Acidimicrobiia bacterium]|nr:hypothetical protein [Acidimicrobiia bacterium]